MSELKKFINRMRKTRAKKNGVLPSYVWDMAPRLFKSKAKPIKLPNGDE